MNKNRSNRAPFIEVTNPSQLVLQVDEFLQLSKRIPSDSPVLKDCESQIFNNLGIRKVKDFDNYMIEEINNHILEEGINMNFSRAQEVEDEIRYPFDRTIRTVSKIEDPMVAKKTLPGHVSSIKVGNYRVIAGKTPIVKRFNTSLLALSSSFNAPGKRR